MGQHHDLIEARESLRYWEDRASRLPRRARRKRVEARQNAARWRTRVAEYERDAYGRGLAGTIVQIASEGRLPEPVRHCAKRATAHGRRAVLIAVAVTAVGLTVMLVGAVGAMLMMLGLL